MAISKKKMKSWHNTRHEGDTGSVEVQVAGLLGKSTTLNDHIKQNKRPR